MSRARWLHGGVPSAGAGAAGLIPLSCCASPPPCAAPTPPSSAIALAFKPRAPSSRPPRRRTRALQQAAHRAKHAHLTLLPRRHRVALRVGPPMHGRGMWGAGGGGAQRWAAQPEARRRAQGAAAVGGYAECGPHATNAGRGRLPQAPTHQEWLISRAQPHLWCRQVVPRVDCFWQVRVVRPQARAAGGGGGGVGGSGTIRGRSGERAGGRAGKVAARSLLVSHAYLSVCSLAGRARWAARPEPPTHMRPRAVRVRPAAAAGQRLARPRSAACSARNTRPAPSRPPRMHACMHAWGARPPHRRGAHSMTRLQKSRRSFASSKLSVLNTLRQNSYCKGEAVQGEGAAAGWRGTWTHVTTGVCSRPAEVSCRFPRRRAALAGPRQRCAPHQVGCAGGVARARVAFCVHPQLLWWLVVVEVYQVGLFGCVVSQFGGGVGPGGGGGVRGGWPAAAAVEQRAAQRRPHRAPAAPACACAHGCALLSGTPAATQPRARCAWGVMTIPTVGAIWRCSSARASARARGASGAGVRPSAQLDRGIRGLKSCVGTMRRVLRPLASSGWSWRVSCRRPGWWGPGRVVRCASQYKLSRAGRGCKAEASSAERALEPCASARARRASRTSRVLC